MSMRLRHNFKMRKNSSNQTFGEYEVRHNVVRSLADTKEWKQLAKRIEEARKDPNFIKFIKKFIIMHGGKAS